MLLVPRTVSSNPPCEGVQADGVLGVQTEAVVGTWAAVVLQLRMAHLLLAM